MIVMDEEGAACKEENNRRTRREEGGRFKRDHGPRRFQGTKSIQSKEAIESIRRSILSHSGFTFAFANSLPAYNLSLCFQQMLAEEGCLVTVARSHQMHSVKASHPLVEAG